MIDYKTPSIQAYRCRKQFHSSEKSIGESIRDWYQRTRENINGCNFGNLSEYMLIDKFVSGLDEEIFIQLTKQSNLSTEQSITNLLECDPLSGGFLEIKTEPVNFEYEIPLDNLFQNDKEEQPVEKQSEVNAFDPLCSVSFFANDLSKKSKNKEITKNLSSKSAINSPSGTIKCFECGDSFPNKNAYDMHWPLRHIRKMGHKCTICNRTFKLPYELRRHLLVHAQSPQKIKPIEDTKVKKKKHECELCGKMYNNERRFEHHVRDHANDGQFECYMCKFTSNREIGLRQHFRRMHMNPEDSKSYRCRHCARHFTTEAELNSHRPLKISPNTRPHLCNLCGRTFAVKCLLEKHMRYYSHDKIGKIFDCYICSHKCDGWSGLKSHFSKQHVLKDEHLCPYCGKIYYNQSNLQIHINVHEGRRELLRCEHCPKTFEFRQHLLNHASVHSTSKDFACKICGGLFKAKKYLACHMRLHARDGPFECTACGKILKYWNAYQSHVQEHSIEPTHKCPKCEECFRDLDNLRVHIGTHNKKPFKCNSCDKAYAHSATLRYHQLKMH